MLLTLNNNCVRCKHVCLFDNDVPSSFPNSEPYHLAVIRFWFRRINQSRHALL